MNTGIESQIRSLVAASLCIDEAVIRPDATLAGDLGADSLDLVSLILAIEDEFHVDIPDEEAAEILTVEQLIEHVRFELAFKDATGSHRKISERNVRRV
jgi:acyl carrier protein